MNYNHEIASKIGNRLVKSGWKFAETLFHNGKGVGWVFWIGDRYMALPLLEEAEAWLVKYEH
jgi:hypothetical protein